MIIFSCSIIVFVAIYFICVLDLCMLDVWERTKAPVTVRLLERMYLVQALEVREGIEFRTAILSLLGGRNGVLADKVVDGIEQGVIVSGDKQLAAAALLQELLQDELDELRME